MLNIRYCTAGDGLPLLVIDPLHADSATDTDTHKISQGLTVFNRPNVAKSVLQSPS